MPPSVDQMTHSSNSAPRPTLDQGERLQGFHYKYYSKCDVIPNVSLADCAPRGFWHYPWCILVALGTRYGMPRMDNLFLPGFWKHHGFYYSACWLFYFAIIAFQFVPLTVTIQFAVGAMISSWVYYFVIIWGILWAPAKFRSLFIDRSFALQFWETILWGAWMGLVITLSLIAKLSFEEDERRLLGTVVFENMKKFYAHPVTVACSWILLIGGGVVKSYCFYLTGLNNYYYYDIILDKPNERFVVNKLYSICSSPTYLIGYLDGYGAALIAGFCHFGSPVLAFLFTALCQISISIANSVVEERFVRKMYLSSKLD